MESSRDAIGHNLFYKELILFAKVGIDLVVFVDEIFLYITHFFSHIGKHNDLLWVFLKLYSKRAY